MARLVFIVSRHRPELFNFLKREFARNDDVDVLVDRRLGERRLQPMPVNREERIADRRLEHIDDRLRSLGWAVIWRHAGTTVYVNPEEASDGVHHQ